MDASIIVGHLVGDYLLQNDWMAQGKKRSSLICAVHVAAYTLAVLACSGWWSVEAAAMVAVPHFLIDRWGFVGWYMRTFGQRAFSQPPMSPWSMIAVDNSMHMVCLLVAGMASR